VEDVMKRVWALGTLAAFVVALAALVVACQGTSEPAAQKPVVEKAAAAEPAAHTPVVEKAAAGEKEDEEKEEKDEQAGAKKYTIATELPAPVKDAFKKSYPKALIRGTAKETEDGKTVYEVESVENGNARDLMYNADGTVISIEEAMNAADLPAPVSAALKKLYPTATITVAEKVTEGKTIQYDLQLKGAAVKSVSFLPNGTVAPPETPEKKS
jgi:hypothetical protein